MKPMEINSQVHCRRIFVGLLVSKNFGSNQARSTLPNRWAHLWVMQGAAGNDLLKRDKSCYDFDSLLAQLEEKGGATIQQSAQDQGLLNKLMRQSS